MEHWYKSTQPTKTLPTFPSQPKFTLFSMLLEIYVTCYGLMFTFSCWEYWAVCTFFHTNTSNSSKDSSTYDGRKIVVGIFNFNIEF